MPQPYWTVAKTHAQRETWASERLTKRGFEVFLPRVASGRTITPLFRSYCFVRIADGRWLAIERCMGVIALIRFGLEPARVPEREVESLMDRVGPDGVLRLPPPPPPRSRRKFARGEHVKIIAGGATFAALHTGLTRRAREVVLLSVLGGVREIEVPRHLCVAAG